MSSLAAAWLSGALAAAGDALGALGVVGEVVHERWIGQHPDGEPIFDAPVLRAAMIQEGEIPHRLQSSGDTITTRACIAFQEVIAPHPAPHRTGPVDPRDRLTIRYGLDTAATGPIVDVRDALTDPATGQVLRHIAWLG